GVGPGTLSSHARAPELDARVRVPHRPRLGGARVHRRERKAHARGRAGSGGRVLRLLGRDELRRRKRAVRTHHDGRRRWVCEAPRAPERAPRSRTRTSSDARFRRAEARGLELGRRLRARTPLTAHRHRGPARAPRAPAETSATRAPSPSLTQVPEAAVLHIPRALRWSTFRP